MEFLLRLLPHSIFSPFPDGRVHRVHFLHENAYSTRFWILSSSVYDHPLSPPPPRMRVEERKTRTSEERDYPSLHHSTPPLPLFLLLCTRLHAFLSSSPLRLSATPHHDAFVFLRFLFLLRLHDAALSRWLQHEGHSNTAARGGETRRE